jgi:5-methylcytosine-specific restriction endonuclease McrA
MLKQCSKCKIEKSLECFNKNKTKNDGLSTECKECVNLYNKKYRIVPENKERAGEYNKVYRVEKAEEIAITKKAYVLEHEEEVRTIKSRHYENNKIAYKARVSQYKKDNPAQYREYNARRRAAKQTSKVEKITIQDVINEYGNRCFYCDNGEFEHIDHYIPLSKDGEHTLKNVRPSCEECNLRKNAKLPEEWYKYLEKRKKIGEKV